MYCHKIVVATILVLFTTSLTFAAIPNQFVQANSDLATLIEKAQQNSEKYKNPVIKAVLNNDIATMQSLIQKGTKTTVTLPGQVSLLFVAIKQDNAAMIEALLKGGTNIDKTVTINNISLRPIEYALLQQNESIISLLLQKGARIFQSTKNLAKAINNPTINTLIFPSKPTQQKPQPTKGSLERTQQSLQETKKTRRELEKSLEETKKALEKNQQILEKEVTSHNGKLALVALQANIESLIEEMEGIDRASRNEDYYAELIKSFKKAQ